MAGYIMLLCFRWGWVILNDELNNRIEKNSKLNEVLIEMDNEKVHHSEDKFDGSMEMDERNLWVSLVKQAPFLFIISFLLSSPIIFLSIFISGSRVYDNRHHISDVVAGYLFVYI
jgi:hypothetical protein